MPCEYSIRKSEGLVYTSTSGIVTFAEVLAHQDALLADPNFDPAFDQLIDNTEAVSFAFGTAEAETIARRAMFSRTSRRAFVAVRPATYGIGRMMAVYQEIIMGCDIACVFTDVETALAWLRKTRGQEASDKLPST